MVLTDALGSSKSHIHLTHSQTCELKDATRYKTKISLLKQKLKKIKAEIFHCTETKKMKRLRRGETEIIKQ